MTYKEALTVLGSRPKQLSDTDLWIFVAVNTAKALFDSTNKDDFYKTVFQNCRSFSEVHRKFDMIKGIYGRKFNQKRSYAYNYLCSLAAFFPDRELTDNDRCMIAEYNAIDEYVVYEF
ncbi:hypothetical protein SAMN02910447_03621 [Ruminococcus sp. YE71]|uniref:hypothetical protein n=1 Tax=unclassified Ruminococcus TaxID=2608920 RepID=UPI000880F1CA|nr:MULTISPECIES: hypothetical protein [unclassified Ruminococcus]SDA33120.1 hypothetical protein SAMN02910446_03723 [Ruminococcus sp. YE78]SFW54521.1 hypothetical protein SAMN02910447_03621 [Ruminococcus sp. YE71]